MDIHREIVKFIEAGRPFAVGLILKADGSTPRGAGVRAVIEETGRIRGTLGGGSVEAEAQRRAVEACAAGQPQVFDLNLEGVSATADGPICGGVMRFLVDPTAAKDLAGYAAAADALEQREKGVLLTTVRRGARTRTEVRWIPDGGSASDPGFPGADAIRACLEKETPRLFLRDAESSGEAVEVLVEPIVPRPLLLIVGGGHIGQALAAQGSLVGFDVTVLDDRPEFANPALFPEGARTLCGDIRKEMESFSIAEDTFIVIVTRGHRYDAEALEACIHSPAAYVGMLGSKRKVAMIRENFLASGLATEEEFRRVFAPIGLDIGGVTVPEIAASIVSQLIAVRRRGKDYRPPGDLALR